MNTNIDELQEGDYLARFSDCDEPDPGSRCGYDDRELDDIRAQLKPRGLRLDTDDEGIIVVSR